MPHTKGALLSLLHSMQFCLRGCNSLWRCFPAASAPCTDIRPTSYPHCCGIFRTPYLAFSRLTRQMPIGLFSLPLLESFNSRGFCAFLRAALPSDHWLPAPTRSVSPLAAVPESFEPSHPLNGVTYIPLSVSLQVALRPHEILLHLRKYKRASARFLRHWCAECCFLFGKAAVLEKIKRRSATLCSVEIQNPFNSIAATCAVESIKGKYMHRKRL